MLNPADYKRCSRGDQCLHPDGPLLPATAEYFYLRDGRLMTICKTCIKAKSEAYRLANPEKVKDYKSQWQRTNAEPLREYKRQWRETNREHVREKQREADKRFHLNSPEKARAQKRRYLANPINRQKSSDYSKRWRAANPEKKKAQKRRWYAKHPEYNRAQGRRWRDANPEKRRVYGIRRRFRQQTLPHTLTVAQWRACLNYWNNSCAYCGSTDRISAEHFIPLASSDCKGTTADNMLPACLSCNCSKKSTAAHRWLTQQYGDQQAAEILARIAMYFEWVLTRN